MFKLFEYIDSISGEIPVIGKVYKASGISKVEELLSDLRNNPDCCVVARDSADGYLNFKDRRLDTGYHVFYVFFRGKLNDHESNLQAKRNAMNVGIMIFDRMKQDSDDFSDVAHGIDFSRVDYSEIGPIGRDYYGYSFSFLVEQGFTWQTIPTSS